MNLKNKKAVEMMSARFLGFVLLLLVILVLIPRITSLFSSTSGNINQVTLMQMQKSCEIGFCQITNCDKIKTCTTTQKSQWAALKHYAQTCQKDPTKCDALANAVIASEQGTGSTTTDSSGSSGSTSSSSGTPTISNSQILSFKSSSFYTQNHAAFESFAKRNSFNVNILYSIIINEGAYDKTFQNSVRFECSYFNNHKSSSDKTVPCTLTNGESFSRVASETNYQAYLNAKAIDSKLAFESSSFGFAQIMGFNYENLGLSIDYNSGLTGISSISSQEKYFFKFITWNNLVPLFKQKNWAQIATKYNGQDYAQNNYATNLQNNYQILVG